MDKRTRRTLIVLALLPSALPGAAGAGQQESSPKWKEYDSPDEGITVLCPAAWTLYSSADRGPFGAMWDENQLLFCIHPGNPDINFNVRLAWGSPPEPFAEKIEPVLREVSSKLGSKVVTFQACSVRGNQSAQLVHTLDRGDVVLQQRLVAVSRPRVGFIWTFTAPQASYDECNRDWFSPILDGSQYSGPRSLLGFWQSLPSWAKGALIGVGVAIVLTVFQRLTRSKAKRNGPPGSPVAAPQGGEGQGPKA